MKTGESAKARSFFEAAKEFPLNLEAKQYYAGGRSCEVFYHEGTERVIQTSPLTARSYAAIPQKLPRTTPPPWSLNPCSADAPSIPFT